jgi:hypothetical protein
MLSSATDESDKVTEHQGGIKMFASIAAYDRRLVFLSQNQFPQEKLMKKT